MSALQKTNRLLRLILGAFLLIAFRVWHLAAIQREEKLSEARRPQRRTVVQNADRGIISDRFGIPLALNRICYRAAVCYREISQMPAVKWTTDDAGLRTKISPRRDYIRSLSQRLSQIVPSLDGDRIEDQIYSKASLFPHVPFVLASNLSEEQYYRLKGLERLWPGLHAEIGSERFYPLGKTASNILGYLGAIDQKEYLAIAGELDLLQQMLSGGSEDESIARRYQELKEKAYTLRDSVGKAGIEKQYEHELRGFYGKKTFEIDQKGNCLRELFGSKEAIPGNTVALSLSAELQQYCEELLMQDEKSRDGRSLGADPWTKTRKAQKQPWIKGGAIVALGSQYGRSPGAGFGLRDSIPTISSCLRKKKEKCPGSAAGKNRRVHRGCLGRNGRPSTRARKEKKNRCPCLGRPTSSGFFPRTVPSPRFGVGSTI